MVALCFSASSDSEHLESLVGRGNLFSTSRLWGDYVLSGWRSERVKTWYEACEGKVICKRPLGWGGEGWAGPGSEAGPGRGSLL